MLRFLIFKFFKIISGGDLRYNNIVLSNCDNNGVICWENDKFKVMISSLSGQSYSCMVFYNKCLVKKYVLSRNLILMLRELKKILTKYGFAKPIWMEFVNEPWFIFIYIFYNVRLGDSTLYDVIRRIISEYESAPRYNNVLLSCDKTVGLIEGKKTPEFVGKLFYKNILYIRNLKKKKREFKVDNYLYSSENVGKLYKFYKTTCDDLLALYQNKKGILMTMGLASKIRLLMAPIIT